MLSLLFLWAALIGVGSALAEAVRLNGPGEEGDASIAFLGYIWCALLFMGWCFLAFSLFLPLRGPLLFAVWAIFCVAPALVIYRKRARVFKTPIPFPAILVIFGVAAILAERSTWIGNLNDTGGYHWNIVQWLNEYGVVPGLGLFQVRLGTTSSWLALTAALNAGPLEGQVLAVANGALLLVTILLFILACYRIYRSSLEIHHWFLAAGVLLLLPTMLRWEMRLSPSPDVPSMLAPLMVAWFILRSERFIAFGLAALAVTVKLNALPLLGISFLAYVTRPGIAPARSALAAMGLSAVVLAPLVAASLLTTGCILFPSPVGCFDIPVGIGPLAAKGYSAIVRNTAEWHAGGAVVVTCIGSAALLFKVRTFENKVWWVCALAVAGIAFVSAFAQDMRFGRGYLLVLPALAIAVHRSWLQVRVREAAALAPRLAGLGAGILLLVAFVQPLYKDALRGRLVPADPSINTANPERWLRPSRLRYAGPFVDRKLNGFSYALAIEGTCWDHPIPCASSEGWPAMQPFRLQGPPNRLDRGFAKP